MNFKKIVICQVRLYLHSMGIVYEDECARDCRLRLQALAEHLERFDARRWDQRMGDRARNHAAGPHFIHRHSPPTISTEKI